MEMTCDNCKFSLAKYCGSIHKEPCKTCCGWIDYKYKLWQPIDNESEQQPNETPKLSTIEALSIILDEKFSLAERKNNDYGDSVANILDKFKESGRNPHLSIYTRLADKFYRYENLLFNGNRKVSDESIDDTLMDLSNYIDLFMAWKKSREVK